MKKCIFTKNIYEEIIEKNTFYVIDKNFSTECGFSSDATLEEKQAFYASASKFSDFMKMVIAECNESVYIGKSFTYNVCHDWSDLTDYDAFNNIKDIISDKCNYKIQLPEDTKVIDYIIENDFRYFTHINFYFKELDLLIEPDCHIQLLCYTDNHNAVEFIKSILEKFDGLKIVKGMEFQLFIGESEGGNE